MGAYECRIGPTPPHAHTLPVPYHPQIDPNWCIPAVILMWLDWASSDSYVDNYESLIWNNATQRGWTGPPSGGAPGGVFPDRIDDLANLYLPFTVSRWTYGSSTQERRQAVADQEKNVDFNDPVIVEVNGGVHAVLFIGASWQELPPGQPSQDYVVTHDPMNRPNDRSSLSWWLGFPGSSCLGGCAANTMRSFRGVGNPHLQEFDDAGGTYYGDPNPPTPGRWKLDNGSCVWRPDAFGANECTSTCNYSVSPSAVTVGPENGAVAFDIATTAGCPWSASLQSNFAYLASPESGTGPATVTYGIENYTAYDEPRYAQLVIAGTTVTLTQNPLGNGDPCESEGAHDHYGACGSTDSCGHSFGSDSDCGCPNAPIVYDTCYQTVCDYTSVWVDEYCEGTTTVCDWDEYCYWNTDGYNWWWQCDWYPYNCREEPYTYVCGGHWEESVTNCREEPYQCNPHQC